MSWPKGRPRPKKVPNLAPTDAPPIDGVEQILNVLYREAEEECSTVPSAEKYPSDWAKGALLNVRNYGEHYAVTLYPEEYSHDREERCIKFTNLGECQAFVSDWYSRQHHDPRAR